MTPRQFKRWVRRQCAAHAISADALAAAIGISHAQLHRYQKGVDQRGRPAPVPLKVRLAMAAFEMGARDFDGERIQRSEVRGQKAP
jgi:hypothetical protein